MIEFNRKRGAYALAGLTSFVWFPIYVSYRALADYGEDTLELCGIEITMDFSGKNGEKVSKDQSEPWCDLHDQHMDKCITKDLAEPSADVRKKGGAD